MLGPDMIYYPEEWRGWAEIALLFAGVYGIIWLIKGARAQLHLLSMALCLIALVAGARLLRLEVLSWLLENFFMVSIIAVMVAFQPELRRSLAELSSHNVFSLARKQDRELIDQIVEVMVQLSHRRFGALIAIRQGMDLDDFAESGVILDAQFSPELVLTVFHPKTPLHDGGLIMEEDRLKAAGCIFPVSQPGPAPPRRAGVLRGDGRHRPGRVGGNGAVFPLPQKQSGASSRYPNLAASAEGTDHRQISHRSGPGGREILVHPFRYLGKTRIFLWMLSGVFFSMTGSSGC